MGDMVDAQWKGNSVHAAIEIAIIVLSDQIGDVFKSFCAVAFAVHALAVPWGQTKKILADPWEQHTCGPVVNCGNHVSCGGSAKSFISTVCDMTVELSHQVFMVGFHLVCLESFVIMEKSLHQLRIQFLRQVGQ